MPVPPPAPPRPVLPHPRGPLSEAIIDHLDGGSSRGGSCPLPVPGHHRGIDEVVDDDLHLALWCCYELHHHGFLGVDEDLEWDPDVIRFRRGLETRFERALRDEEREESLPTDARTALRVIAERASPPLSGYVESQGTLDELREFAIHRSIYQLKEADAHTFGIPRLAGPGRSAYIEIQMDEYGSGRPGEAHSELFAAAMRELDLDDRFGAHVDRVPGTTLATDNLISMFALNRRLRGALIGHLALFETTSVTPMSRYLSAARRLGDGAFPAVERFYAVHVEADAHHGRIALEKMVDGFVRSEPDLRSEIIFGAVALSRVESRFARHLLDSWGLGQSSLRPAPDHDQILGRDVGRYAPRISLGTHERPERPSLAGDHVDVG